MALRPFGTRAAGLRLLLLCIVAAIPIAGCGAPGSMHSALPATVVPQVQAGANDDAQRALDASVAQAHADVAGTSAYGTIDGVWVTPTPAPGKAGYYLIDGETLPGRRRTSRRRPAPNRNSRFRAVLHWRLPPQAATNSRAMCRHRAPILENSGACSQHQAIRLRWRT